MLRLMEISRKTFQLPFSYNEVYDSPRMVFFFILCLETVNDVNGEGCLRLEGAEPLLDRLSGEIKK